MVTWTPHEKSTGMHLMRIVTLTVNHKMTECRSNEEERQKHDLPTKPSEIIGPDCQPEKRHVIPGDHRNGGINLRVMS